jgi:hypothetical protein
MSETAEPLDCYQGTWRRLGCAQRVVHGDPSAQQRSGVHRIQDVRDANHAAGADVHVLRVATVLRSPDLRLGLAIHEIAAPTLVAFMALATEIADADAVANLGVCSRRRQPRRSRQRSRGRYDRRARVTQQALDGNHVTVADAACQYPDAYLP